MSQPLFKFVQGIGKIFLVGDGDVAPHRIGLAGNARHIAQSAAADVEKRSVGSEFVDQRGRQRGRNHLRQMADPGAEAVVFGGIEHARRARRSSRRSGQTLRTVQRATFWPGSGVKSHAAPSKRSASANSTPACSLPAMGCPARKRWAALRPNDFAARWTTSDFGAADIGDQRASAGSDGPSRSIRSMIANHRRGQHDEIAAAHRVGGIGGSFVDGAAILGTLQHGSAIAANDAAGEMALLRGQGRASLRSGRCR